MEEDKMFLQKKYRKTPGYKAKGSARRESNRDPLLGKEVLHR